MCPHSVGKALHPLSSSKGWTDYNPSCHHLVSLTPLPAWETLPTNQCICLPVPWEPGGRMWTLLFWYYKACLQQPLLAHRAPHCSLHVAFLLALSAFFPNCKYIWLIIAANLIQPVLGTVCLAISHYWGWGGDDPLSLQELIKTVMLVELWRMNEI